MGYMTLLSAREGRMDATLGATRPERHDMAGYTIHASVIPGLFATPMNSTATALHSPVKLYFACFAAGLFCYGLFQP